MQDDMPVMQVSDNALPQKALYLGRFLKPKATVWHTGCSCRFRLLKAVQYILISRFRAR